MAAALAASFAQPSSAIPSYRSAPPSRLLPCLPAGSTALALPFFFEVAAGASMPTPPPASASTQVLDRSSHCLCRRLGLFSLSSNSATCDPYPLTHSHILTEAKQQGSSEPTAESIIGKFPPIEQVLYNHIHALLLNSHLLLHSLNV